MAKSSSIKASEVYQTIRADEGNLPQVIESARKRAKDFAGSMAQLGEKVSGKFGSAIMGGLVGFSAVSAVDRALDELVKVAEEWGDGAAASAWDIGARIGQSIMDGWTSIPIFGDITKLIGVLVDPIWGSPMQIERSLDAVAKQREALQAILSQIGSASGDIDSKIATFGDPAGAERLDMLEKASGFVNRLVGAGYSLRFAIDSVDGITSAFERLMTMRADDEFFAINNGLKEMAGIVPQDTKALQQFEKQLESLSQMLRAAGRANEIDELTGALRKGFEWAIATRDAAKGAESAEKELKQRQETIGEIIENLRESFLHAGLDDNIRIRFDLTQLGASEQQMREAQRLLGMLDEFRQFEKDSAEVTGIINELRGEVDRANLGERALLEKRLVDLKATQEEIDTALSLFDRTNSASIESAFTGTFNPAALDFGSEFGGLESASRETARNTRRIANAIEKNQLTYGN